MNLGDAIRHPHLFARKAVGRLQRQIARLPEHPVHQRMPGGVVFEHRKLSFLDEDDMRAMLTHSYEIALCDYFARRLKPGGIVLDVGANIGYISAVAASYLGDSGEVHGFEPLIECFERLQALSRLNPRHRLIFHNVAAGARKTVSSIAFNPLGDVRNATLVPGRRSTSAREVPVWRLDDYICENIASPERIQLIKIDVEGFEFSVLQGLERFLANWRPVIVCEIKPWEIKNLGYTMQDFAQYMQRFKYRAYDLIREGEQVDLSTLEEMETLLFRASR